MPPSYFEHFGSAGRDKPVVELDVIEFDQAAGIEVTERQFDSTGEFLAYLARETGRGP